MSFSSPLASELRAAQVGARRGAHVGERTAGLERQPGSRGSAPLPFPPLYSSPPRGDAAPPDARLRRLRRSPGSSRLTAAA